jgi:dihydrofolate synthase/folylpolyglutamate synthase
VAKAPLSFEQTVALLSERVRFGIHPSLDTIRALTEQLGRPQDSLTSIQVTGTNGKTSVARLVAALLSAHGHRTATYTSPHLASYTERVELDGAQVAEADFARSVAAALEAADAVAPGATEFELLTAAALWLMRDLGVEWAVLEVGMGGRWDATSVVAPKVAVVTGVGLDHTDRLGMTVEEIAFDKAHIIKPGSTAVLGPGCAGVEHVFFERALATGAPTVRVGEAEDDVVWRVTDAPNRPGGTTTLDVDTALARYLGLVVTAPSYQAPNVATAIAVAEAALGGPLDPGRTRNTLASMAFPGRFELVRENPPLVIDGAHNPQAAGVLACAIREAFGAARPTIVLGVMADKDAGGIVRALAPVASAFICTRSASPRALAPESLASVVRAGCAVPAVAATDVAAALLAVGSVPAVVTGSIYTAGEAREAVWKR